MTTFAKLFGGPPAGRWAAPGRVNLVGEHTDYNDGYCLPFALPRRTVVAAAPGSGSRWRVHSVQAGETVTFEADGLVPGAVEGWGAYVAGVVWALRDAGHDVPGASLLVESDVPTGSGLSSSHALECAVLRALHDLAGLDLPPFTQAKLVQRAENGYVGAPTGLMDQTASLLCTAGHALFFDVREETVEQVPFDLPGAGLVVLVVDTKAPHQNLGGEYADRRRACEEAASALGVRALRDVTADDLDAALDRLRSAGSDDDVLRRVRHVVTEDDRVLRTVDLLRAGDVRAIGPLLSASHASMRDDFEITVPQIDTAFDAALGAGALGARMTGGGFGGCVIALVEAEREADVAEAVAAAFADRGFTAPSSFPVVPSEGARRLS